MTQQHTPKEAGMRLYVYFFISLFSGKWRLLFYGTTSKRSDPFRKNNTRRIPGAPPRTHIGGADRRCRFVSLAQELNPRVGLAASPPETNLRGVLLESTFMNLCLNLCHSEETDSYYGEGRGQWWGVEGYLQCAV